MRRRCLVALLLLACSDPADRASSSVRREPHATVRTGERQDEAIEPEVIEPEVIADVVPETEPSPHDTIEPADTAEPAEVEPAEVEPEDTAEPADTAEPEVVAEVTPDVIASPCPLDMALVGAACMDLHEAPNHLGEPPFVMYTLYEAERWCEARDKRLCYDDEWTSACAGDQGWKYPYGDAREPGRCHDDRLWRAYVQALLNGWPYGLAIEDLESLDELMALVRSRGAAAADAADHVMSLYQGALAGDHPECAGEAGVYDLVGNVEEWTLRRDGGSGPDFSGALKGRYWAESRTCQSTVTTHGNAFRFYEIGFRCCRDAAAD